jgi:hypothetical protein
MLFLCYHHIYILIMPVVCHFFLLVPPHKKKDRDSFFPMRKSFYCLCPSHWTGKLLYICIKIISYRQFENKLPIVPLLYISTERNGHVIRGWYLRHEALQAGENAKQEVRDQDPDWEKSPGSGSVKNDSGSETLVPIPACIQVPT